jgi:5-deoxy-glucuronate isomerase
MPNLRIKRPADRHIIVTPESAGWTYVGFEISRSPKGTTLGGNTGDRELCLVLVAGRAQVTAGGTDFGELGRRMSPFDGPPAAVYVPAQTDWSLTSTTELDLACCTAPGGGELPARIIKIPKTIVRGKGTNTRYVTNILPENEPADSLLVVEVITPGGNTSSYPPHKHDTDDLPNESLLEETYYHRLQPPQGFAMQRVYTDDRSLDEALVIENGDVTLVPRGYHPVAAVHGYDLYYLNVMAGPKRTWKFHNAKEHEWLMKA